ncbi:MAG: methylase, partial [Tissierellia bacterium]|nr:methylase [Tissierellia bacterium]
HFKNNYIYINEALGKKVQQINAYLVEAPMIFIQSMRKPLTEVQPMVFGSMPNDGGYLILTTEEKEELETQYPESKQFIRRFLGAREFINNVDRWCLWIEPQNLLEVSKIKPVMERIKKVKEIRLNSKRKSTKELANYPYRFGEVRQPKDEYLLVPSTSSENRKYIPIGFVDSKMVSSNANLIIPKPSLSLFSILSSNVHMAWMRAVAGRLEMRYRYSASIVYNNFPFIELNNEQKLKLDSTGEKILEARKLYSDWSFAQLYNELTMPPELRRAHQENDKAVMEVYGFDWRNMTESECVAELMKMYQNLTK